MHTLEIFAPIEILQYLNGFDEFLKRVLLLKQKVYMFIRVSVQMELLLYLEGVTGLHRCQGFP